MFSRPIKTLTYGAALSVLLAGGALAQTAPGTPVRNTISLSYETGAGEISLTESELPVAEFIVDRKIDLGLRSERAIADEVTAPAGSQQVVLAFKLQNNGNGTQDFEIGVVRTGTLGLTASSSATATPGLGEYSIVTSTTHDLSGTVSPLDGNIEDLEAGSEIFLLIVANIPLDAEDNLADDFTVTATALTDAGGTIEYRRDLGLMGENVIAVDTASDSTLSPGTELSPAEDGIDADQGRIRVSTPMISATKNVIVVSEDPTFACNNLDLDGNPPSAEAGAIPGACIEYIITVDNSSANASATNVIISDALPSQLAYRAHSTDFIYTMISDGSAGSGDTSVMPTQASGTISGTIATLPAGQRATLRIRATIN